MENNEKLYILIYIALWLLTFLWFKKKRKKSNMGVGLGGFAILSYFIFGVLAYVLHSATNDFKGITLFPFIYLFVSILIALIPILNFRPEIINNLKEPSHFLFNSISVVIIICTLARIPYFLTNGVTGMIFLLTDDSYGDDMYNNMAMNYANGGDGTINFFPLFMNAFSTLCLLMFIYSLTMKKINKVVYYGLIVSTIIIIIDPILNGSRTLPVLNILTLTSLFLLFNKWIPEHTTKTIKRIGVVFFIFIAALLTALTVSRISNDEDSRELTESISSYAGQAPLYFNLYGFDANGTRDGDRIMPVFKKMVGQKVPNNFVERRAKYSHMKLNDANFSTFVGDFCLDFGPLFTFILIVFTTFCVNKSLKPKGGTLYFDQIILLYMVLCTVIQGGMYLWPFADIGGNLKFLVLIIAYIIFRFYRLNYEKS